MRPGATDVPILSRQDIVVLKPRLAVRSVGQFTRRLAVAVAVFFAAFWLAHLFRRWRRRDDDPLLLPALMLLCGIGLMTMCALRDPIRDTIAAELFAAGAAIGIVLLVAVSEVDFEASPLRRAVLLPLGLACALAALLLLFGSGPGSSGVKVNLLGVQPVEAIRLLVVFALAAYFGRRLELLRELSEPATPSRPWLRLVRVPRWRDVRPVLAGMALVLRSSSFRRISDPRSCCRACSSGCSGSARGRAGSGRDRLRGAARRVRRGVLDRRAADGAQPRDDLGRPVEQRRAGRQPHGARPVGARRPAARGAAAPASAARTRSLRVTPTSSSAAIGEELGWVGFAVVVGLYAFLCWRCLRIAARAPGDFTAFLVGRRRARARRAGAGHRRRPARPHSALGSGDAVSQLRPIVDAGELRGDRRRARRSRAGDRPSARTCAGRFASLGAVLRSGRRRDPVARRLGAGRARGRHRGRRRAWPNRRTAAIASSTTRACCAAARSLERGSIYDRNGLPLATSRADEIAALERHV